MEYIYIGRIVNTHGIRGEVKLLSDFECKKDVFKKSINIYIGNKKIKEVINTYRKHKTFDMITIKGIENINDILKYKGDNVYIKEKEITFTDKKPNKNLIGLKVYTNNKLIGKVTNVRKNPGNDIIEVNNTILIPYVTQIVTVKEDKIEVIEMEGIV